MQLQFETKKKKGKGAAKQDQQSYNDGDQNLLKIHKPGAQAGQSQPQALQRTGRPEC